MTTLILFASLVLCLIARVPIGISLGMAALTTISYSGIVTTRYLAQTLTTSLDSFPLMAVPFFILAGDLMGSGGISRRLILVANIFLGGITGGMAIVTVTACMFFAAISGSGPATVAAIGGLVIPEMLRQGYSKPFVCGLIAAAGTIGVIIPHYDVSNLLESWKIQDDSITSAKMKQTWLSEAPRSFRKTL